MNSISIKKIKKFINKLNCIVINQISTVKSGKNSKIYKINTDKKKIILKSYYGKKKNKNKKRISIL